MFISEHNGVNVDEVIVAACCRLDLWTWRAGRRDGGVILVKTHRARPKRNSVVILKQISRGQTPTLHVQRIAGLTWPPVFFTSESSEVPSTCLVQIQYQWE
jgi:hypothetical protein